MKLLLISPVPTDPATTGNRARVLSLVTALEHLGHDVTFAYVPYDHGTEDYKAMERRFKGRLCVLQTSRPPFPNRIGSLKRRMRGVLRLQSARSWDVDEWFDENLLRQIENLQDAKKFETVLIEYIFLSKLATVFPSSVKTLIDTHDLFGDRHALYVKSGLNPTWFTTTTREEVRALTRADAVIAIQDEEAAYLKLRGIHEVFCVGHVSTREPMLLPDPGGKRILFVGSDNPINIQGLEWFVERVWPQIRATAPTCELAIAGRAGLTRAWPNGVLILGELESLASAYEQATVVINPVVFGTGLAVKTIEALGYGKPLVATAAGVRGLGSEFAAAASVAQDEGVFAQRVIELLGSKEARDRQSRSAIATIKVWRLRQLATLDAAVR